jgi:hypothetical protein
MKEQAPKKAAPTEKPFSLDDIMKEQETEKSKKEVKKHKQIVEDNSYHTEGWDFLAKKYKKDCGPPAPTVAAKPDSPPKKKAK